MKIFLNLLVTLILISAMVSDAAWEQEKFTVEELDRENYLYPLIKNKMPPMTYPKNEESFDTKALICTLIIKSNRMRITRNLAPVDLRKKSIYKELKQHYPKIYAEYFPTKNANFTNPYKLRNVTGKYDEDLDEDRDEMESFVFQEYMFSCLARHRVSKTIEEYFISEEYDLKECNDKEILPRIIRWIFKYNEKRDIIISAYTDDVLEYPHA